MSQFIDRRLDGKNKSTVNRQRFIQRFKRQIKRAVADAMSERSIKDMHSGEKINIPSRDLSEPVFGHGPGGRREIIHPGNKEFVTGDRVPRPRGSGGNGSGGGQASDRGEGEDEFTFQLTRDEFLDLFFEDLSLPNLVKTELAKVTEHRWVRAGFVSDGVPSNIHVVRSMKQALARRKAMQAPYRGRLRAAEEKLAALEEDDPQQHEDADEDVLQLRDEVSYLKGRIRAIPFIDTLDLRYNNRIKEAKPSTQAVMFCLMDVSGSMNQERKDLAKRFFTLLYLFLTRNYEHIDVVFIRHHTIAKEVDEEEFFYSRETGGTVVSSALEMMANIVRERYPVASWNIYAAQASDGDNWHTDSPICRNILTEQLMPLVRYFAYVEITPDRHQSLWEAYLNVQENCPHFAMRQIDGPGDIYPVFRDLFKRKEIAA